MFSVRNIKGPNLLINLNIESILTRDMQHARATCTCADETLGLAEAISSLGSVSAPTVNTTSSSSSTPISSSLTLAFVPFDEILDAGRTLIRTWERINGCSNAEAHEEGHLVRAVLDAADGMLKLYEALDIRNASSVNEFSAKSNTSNNTPQNNGMTRTQWTAESSISSWSSASHSLDETSLYRGVPVYLGSLRLDEEESVIVAREALRHAVLCLGEVLQDIEDDVKESASVDNSCTYMVDEERLGVVTSRLLRLLGRINRAAG
ncbi:hypothetical protein F4678DRAFT_253333 [Xylaria arbuscula]|nr:hypothetical protein F4678DRAFT_253333 [Xylaria arbuscula]